jgi:hypothetical protein
MNGKNGWIMLCVALYPDLNPSKFLSRNRTESINVNVRRHRSKLTNPAHVQKRVENICLGYVHDN